MIKDPEDKWYDHKFVHHTLGGLDCFPVYMQASLLVERGWSMPYDCRVISIIDIDSNRHASSLNVMQ